MAGFSFQREVTIRLQLPDGTEVRLNETDYNDLCTQIIAERKDLVLQMYAAPVPKKAKRPVRKGAPKSSAPTELMLQAPSAPVPAQARIRRNPDQIEDDVLRADFSTCSRYIPSTIRLDPTRLEAFVTSITKRDKDSHIARAVRAHGLPSVLDSLRNLPARS